MSRTVVLRDARGERRAIVSEQGVVTIEGREIKTAPAGSGERRVSETQRTWVAASGDVRWVFFDGGVYEIEVVGEGRRVRAGSARGSLAAPMPATVVRVDVSAGDKVRAGDTLLILEAMKMELPIRATADGIVKAVHCKAGDLVQSGFALVDLE
jgi:biotin carboxyl carrier protein